MIRLFILTLCLALSPLDAYAMKAGIDINKIPKVKDYDPIENYEQRTKRVEESSPYNEKLLSYQIFIPKSWTDNVQQPPMEAGNSPLSDTVLGMLGRYIAAPKNLLRSYVTVEGQGMTYEISAMHWFINFMLLNGFSLTALTEKSPQEIEALYVQVVDDTTYIVRTKVIINGNRLIMVRYYLPQDNYEQEKQLQAQLMKTFSLLQPTEEKIEDQETYGFLDQSFFNFPVSWNLRDKSILTIERMGATLYQEKMDGKKSVLEGQIRINVISRLLKTTLGQEIEKYRAGIKIKDYEIGELLDTVDYKYDPSIKFGKAQVYRLIPRDPVNMQSYEFLVTVMQGDDYYYITSMITPSREQDFYAWARNMEAARIVNETMRRTLRTDKIDPNDPYFEYLNDEDVAKVPPAAGEVRPSDVPMPKAIQE